MEAGTRTERTLQRVAQDNHPVESGSIERSAVHGKYTHELPEETTEAISRALVRIVPLAYGTLLGSLADSTAIGLTAALAISLAFDWSMEEHSIVRGVFRRLPQR